MEKKSILVVYYSRSGNTERLAKDIAPGLDADLEKVIDLKNRSGIMGFILGGRDAMKKIPTKIESVKFDPSEYDLVAVGTPVWGGNIVPAVRTYFNSQKGQIKKLVFFETSGSTLPEKIAGSIEEAAQKKPLAFAGFGAKELKDAEIYKTKLEDFIEAVKAVS
ncbi:MAG TPA: flavodoxin [Candidatus Paceibacterota bacterium]|nr:flavodoxin [Candidatus Pacearchaeota archaeon]HRZ50828.1 flavodoxin [Candidatus Paceibacterota bacterium]HSA36549.1 flavodoxin [Candidatus Paceibacterota bacterium]